MSHSHQAAGAAPRVAVAAVIAACVLLTGTGAGKPFSRRRDFVSAHTLLQTRFQTPGGYLFLGNTRDGMPVELGRGLWYRRGAWPQDAPTPTRGGARIPFFPRRACDRILRLRQLRGRVQVRHGEDALSFVRLATSPLLFYTCRGPDPRNCLDIFVPSRDGPEVTFGWTGGLEGLARVAGGYMGALTQEQSDGMRLPAPMLRLSGNGWEVARVLLCVTDTNTTNTSKRTYSLLRVRESVGVDGEYQVLERREEPLPTGTGVTWVVPWFE